MVQEGRSDDEIKAVFVREYSKRILAMPEGTERWWLDLTPGAFMIAGLFIVVAKLRERRQISNRALPLAAGSVDFDDSWEEE